MTPYEYALRDHPEPDLTFHTVWLYGWDMDKGFRVMQALTRKLDRQAYTGERHDNRHQISSPDDCRTDSFCQHR